MNSPLLLIAVAAALSALPAVAEDCSPPKLLSTVQLVPKDDGRVEFIPVDIGGERKFFLFDTGAFATMVTAATADELHLKRFSSNIVAYSATGTKSDEHVRASFAIGSLKAPSVEFGLYPGTREHEWAGLVGSAMLSRFDISVDFGAHKLDIIDQDHCEGRVVYWPERPIAVVPFRQTPFSQIIVKVKLDGKEFKALIDTGAGNSTLEQFAARRNFGVVVGDADTPVIGNLNREDKLVTGLHRFHTLELEGLQVSNPEVTIIPDAINVHFSDGEKLLDHDIILGMNVLRRLHLYIAYKEKKLYITPASEKAK